MQMNMVELMQCTQFYTYFFDLCVEYLPLLLKVLRKHYFL